MSDSRNFSSSPPWAGLMICAADGRMSVHKLTRRARQRFDQLFKSYEELKAMLGQMINRRGNDYLIDMRELRVK